MNLCLAKSVALIVMALSAAIVPEAVAKESLPYEGIQWQQPSAAINEAAKANNKLILADFYADWCGYCQMQDATSYQDDRVILMTDVMVATKVNEKTNRGLIEQNKVTSYPTAVVFNAQGEEVDRSKGAYQESEGYFKWLGTALYQNALPNLQSALQKEPDNIKLLAITALIHSAADRKDQVPTLLKRAGDAALKKFEAGEKLTADNTGQMARAFRMLVIYFESHQDYERSAAVLHYLAQLTSNPREAAYARFALAETYYQSNRTPKAIAELESLLKTDVLTPEERQDAEAKLNTYKRAAA